MPVRPLAVRPLAVVPVAARRRRSSALGARGASERRFRPRPQRPRPAETARRDSAERGATREAQALCTSRRPRPRSLLDSRPLAGAWRVKLWFVIRVVSMPRLRRRGRPAARNQDAKCSALRSHHQPTRFRLSTAHSLRRSPPATSHGGGLYIRRPLSQDPATHIEQAAGTGETDEFENDSRVPIRR